VSPRIRRLAAALCLPAALACSISPEAARKKLSDQGIAFTPEEFVRRAGSDPWSTLALFLAGGMDPNAKADAGASLEGVTALMAAARSGRLDVVRRLREAGGRIDAETRQGNAALMYAASGCHTDVIAFLLSSGADVNHANRAGETALLWAIPASWPAEAPPWAADGVNRLLAAGAGVNGRSRDGETALHEAIGRKQLALVRLLLLRGADPNLKGGKQNISPLMHAVLADQAGIVAALLSAGADPGEPGLLQSVSGGLRSNGDAVREALRKGGVGGAQAAN
jgi:hypothetical protein